MAPNHPLRRLRLPTAAAFVFLALWDAAGLDRALTAAVAAPGGFGFRGHWLLTTVLHDGARGLTAVLLVGLLVSVWKPFGPLRQLARADRIWLLAVTAGAMLLISAIKRFSLTSCPWDLQPYGGMASYVSHWQWGRADGGPGHCFPAGHASAAFAWVSGFFALHPHHRRAARVWLAVALAAGLLLGISQQLRGAHYMSHTLWTAWLCWTFAWLCSPLLKGQPA